MPLLAFLASAAYWPWFISSSNDAKLLVLSIGVPLAFAHYRPRLTAWPLWAFLALLALSLAWGPFWDGLERLWYFVLLGLAFHLGTVVDVRRALFWWGLGVAVSSLLTVPQILGWEWIGQAVSPAGLMMNKNYVAEASAMALAGGGPVLLLLTGLLLPGSVGALLGFGMMVFWRWRALGIVLLVIGAVFLAWKLPGRSTTDVRLAYWANSLAAVWDQPWGHGAGSFWSVYPFYHDALVPTPLGDGYSEGKRPRTAHNDLLTVLVETGVPGAALLVLLVFRCLRGRSSEAKWLFVVFLGCGLTAFPLFNPATGFIAALAAGRLYSDWDRARQPDVFG